MAFFVLLIRTPVIRGFLMLHFDNLVQFSNTTAFREWSLKNPNYSCPSPRIQSEAKEGLNLILGESNIQFHTTLSLGLGKKMVIIYF